ncbi:hypothetical protein [Shinella sp.]
MKDLLTKDDLKQALRIQAMRITVMLGVMVIILVTALYVVSRMQ